MAFGKPDLRRITINDFRPGIAMNPPFNYPPGQAQQTNTYKCIAEHSGALVPLPSNNYTLAGPTAAPAPSNGNIYIVGFYIPPFPVVPATGTDSGRDHDLFLAMEWTDGTNRRLLYNRVRVFESAGGGTNVDTLKNLTIADTTTAPSVYGMSFGSTRSNRAAPTTPGVPVVVAGWSFIPAFNTNFVTEFPDDQATTSATPFDIIANRASTAPILTTHQNRVVIRLITGYSNGPNANVSTSENIQWTAANDVTPANLSAINSFGSENPSGYAILADMSANELFGLKEIGAVMLAGDLVSPTVVNYPMVVGSGVVQEPAYTTAGVVYGNAESGVWIWAHGDTSRLISPYMDPSFWMMGGVASGDNFVASRYQFAHIDRWVLCPNNYLYDLVHDSWWRLENPATVTFRRMGRFLNIIYGVPSSYTNAANTAVYGYDRFTPASSYSWNSQPLRESIDQRIDVREIALRATGTGTIAITVTAQDGSAHTVTFTYSTIIPQLQRQNIRVQGDNVTIRIVSTGTANPAVAPTVNELNVGYLEAQLAGVSGSYA